MNSGGPNKHTWTPRWDSYKDMEMDIEADFLSPAVQPRKDFVNEFLHLWKRLCEKRSALSFSLKTHYSEVHVDEKKRTCKCCRKIFKTVASMKRHIQSTHKGLLIFNMNEDQYTFTPFSIPLERRFACFKNKSLWYFHYLRAYYNIIRTDLCLNKNLLGPPNYRLFTLAHFM